MSTLMLLQDLEYTYLAQQKSLLRVPHSML